MIPYPGPLCVEAFRFNRKLLWWQQFKRWVRSRIRHEYWYRKARYSAKIVVGSHRPGPSIAKILCRFKGVNKGKLCQPPQ